MCTLCVFVLLCNVFFNSILSTRWPPNIYRKDNHVLAIMVSRVQVNIPTNIHILFPFTYMYSHLLMIVSSLTLQYPCMYIYRGGCVCKDFLHTIGFNLYYICICGLQAEHKCEGLLQHPLVVTMLNEKWFQFGAQLYVWNLLLYILQVLFLTAFSLSLPHPLSPSCESPHIHSM